MEVIKKIELISGVKQRILTAFFFLSAKSFNLIVDVRYFVSGTLIQIQWCLITPLPNNWKENP